MTRIPNREKDLVCVELKCLHLTSFIALFQLNIIIKYYFYCNLVLVTQSCLTVCDPMGCSPPGSSVHGILQARILEWVAISFFRGSS